MQRPHFLTVFGIAFAIVLITFFLPPLISFGDPISHGFPFGWITITESNIPIFGDIGWLFTGSYHFDIIGFVADLIFYFAIMWLIVVKTSKSK